MCDACSPALSLIRHTTSANVLTAPAGRRASHRRRQSRTGTHPVRHRGNHVADLIIGGGPVLTMDSDRPRAESVAVSDGRIVAVGSTDELASWVGPDTEVLDLDGRALLPGLIDPHMHAAMVQLADWTDISPMSTATEDEVFAALRAATPLSTGWVLAKQFDPTITKGHPRLDRHVLDRLIPDRPVLVLESNGHVAYVNSAALTAAKVDRNTPDPPTARYQRDADGELTGRLEESPALAAFLQAMPAVSPAEVADRLRNLLWHAAGQGVTLLHDCGIGAAAGPSDLDVLQAAVDADSPVRYRGMLVSTHFDAWTDMGLEPGFGDDLLRVDGIKAWSDGSNQGGPDTSASPTWVPRAGGRSTTAPRSWPTSWTGPTGRGGRSACTPTATPPSTSPSTRSSRPSPPTLATITATGSSIAASCTPTRSSGWSAWVCHRRS